MQSPRTPVRRPGSAGGDSAACAADAQADTDNSDVSKEARSTWARLLKKNFEVDPFLRTCGARMRIISFITRPRVIDRILDALSDHCGKLTQGDDMTVVGAKAL